MINAGERVRLCELVAQSEAALEKLDRFRHDGAPTLEREALRRLREEHETIKAMLGELAGEREDDTPTEAA